MMAGRKEKSKSKLCEDQVLASTTNERKQKQQRRNLVGDAVQGAGSAGAGSAGSAGNEENTTINFVSGNPFVEVTKGVLHLYKEEKSDKGVVYTGKAQPPNRTSNTICFLAVPASMSCHDLMTFVAAFHDDISHVRIIRDGSPNQYMALVTFRSEDASRAFYSAFQGISFNSLEPEQHCHLVFVSRVEIIGEDSRKVPPPAHNELPTCPVCLERMDESLDVILAILCNHAFHGGCLAKWEDASCPVCRYVQTPEAVADNRCMECHSNESLWICLLCGHVGCGRYIGGHAYQHYLESQHCYCMELGNNRVWDYVGDNFVHRLLQNKGDGKLVEGPAPGKEDDTMDSMQMEFTYMLSSQLDAQRRNYEEKINRLEKDYQSQIGELKKNTMNQEDDCKTLKLMISKLNKDKQLSEKRIQLQTQKINQLQIELNEEKEINKALRQNQKEFKDKMNNQEMELNDLKEQIRDLMFNLEAGRQIASCEERDEIAEGHIVVPEQSPQGSSGKNRRRRSNKNK